MSQQLSLWNDFCVGHAVFKAMVPLFATNDLKVKTKVIGRDKTRSILCRSPEMEALIRSECTKLVVDWKQKAFTYDGLIYMMLLEEAGNLIPLYIGKAETIGKGAGNLSANIKNIETDTSKFARWGDNYAYHIGDLSAVVIPGHDPKKANPKYKDWANRLFREFPTEEPELKSQVYFWCKAWSGKNTGPWVEFGPTRLTFLEYVLIGLASSAFGERLLNREGRNRG